MDWDDSEPVRKPAATIVGEKLDALSVDDLRSRIEQLRAEIARVENEIQQRGVQQSAADALFKS